MTPIHRCTYDWMAVIAFSLANPADRCSYLKIYIICYGSPENIHNPDVCSLLPFSATLYKRRNPINKLQRKFFCYSLCVGVVCVLLMQFQSAQVEVRKRETVLSKKWNTLSLTLHCNETPPQFFRNSPQLWKICGGRFLQFYCKFWSSWWVLC